MLPLEKVKICHQDHGAQYTSKKYLELLKKNNILPSMSRIANSTDNRLIEYF
jgi:putative transposase